MEFLNNTQDAKKTRRKKNKTTVEENLTTEADTNEAETIKKTKKLKVSRPDVHTADEGSLSVGEKTKKSKDVVDTDSSNKTVPETVPENSPEGNAIQCLFLDCLLTSFQKYLLQLQAIHPLTTARRHRREGTKGSRTWKLLRQTKRRTLVQVGKYLS